MEVGLPGFDLLQEVLDRAPLEGLFGFVDFGDDWSQALDFALIFRSDDFLESPLEHKRVGESLLGPLLGGRCIHPPSPTSKTLWVRIPLFQGIGTILCRGRPGWGSDAHGIESAVDDHLGASDESASLIGGQEEGGADEFFGAPEAGSRGMPEDFSHAAFVEDGPVLLGWEEAGDEGVDPDIPIGPFPGEVAGQVVDRGLGAGVGKDPGEGVQAGDGADIDDGSLHVAAQEVVSKDLAGAEDADEVGVDDAGDVIVGDFEERGGGVDPGAVDEDIGAAGLSDDAIEQVVEGFPVRNLSPGKVGATACSLDGLEAGIGLFLVASY